MSPSLYYKCVKKWLLGGNLGFLIRELEDRVILDVIDDGRKILRKFCMDFSIWSLSGMGGQKRGTWSTLIVPDWREDRVIQDIMDVLGRPLGLCLERFVSANIWAKKLLEIFRSPSYEVTQGPLEMRPSDDVTKFRCFVLHNSHAQTDSLLMFSRSVGGI